MEKGLVSVPGRNADSAQRFELYGLAFTVVETVAASAVAGWQSQPTSEDGEG